MHSVDYLFLLYLSIYSLILCVVFFFFFFFNDTATTEIYTLSLHDALPIYCVCCSASCWRSDAIRLNWSRSEEHTSELQSQSNLVCRLLLEKKKKRKRELPECINFAPEQHIDSVDTENSDHSPPLHDGRRCD